MKFLHFVFNTSIWIHTAIIFMWVMVAIYSGMEEHYLKQIAMDKGLVKLSSMTFAELGGIVIKKDSYVE